MTMKKDMFLGLQKKETDILEKMFVEKTTKSLFNEYVNIVDKKRQLLMNYTKLYQLLLLEKNKTFTTVKEIKFEI